MLSPSVKRKPRSRLGIGLYSLKDVSRLTGASVSSIEEWSTSGMLPRFFAASEQTLIFQELVEVFVIQWFRKERVSLAVVQLIRQAAAKDFQTTYPFAAKRFVTEGSALIERLLASPKANVTAKTLGRAQTAFEQVLRPFFAKLDYRGVDEAARYWPSGRDGRIVLDPNRKFGQAIDAETGISTRTIFQACSAGDGQDPATVAQWLGIPLAAIDAALAFERSLTP